jgi:hypothetical protein
MHMIDISGNFVYVVWVDETNFKGPGDILFRSTDGGNSFGATINLSNDVSGSGKILVVMIYSLEEVLIMELHLKVL